MTSNNGSSQLPNYSLSWTQNGRSEQRIKPSATLDLHGYNKEQAIRELTLFLERHSNNANANRRSPWVCIITGTGSHSGAIGGPVLKTAVHRLLEKRHMEYCYARKKGSFFVNAQSGIELRANPTVEEQQLAASAADGNAAVLQDPLFQDTKVRLVQQQLPALQLPKNNNAIKMGKKMRKALPHQFAAKQDNENTSNTTIPTLTQLAEEEKLLEQAKTHSLEETRKWKSQKDKEQHALQQALQKTQQEALEEEQREQEELRKAMELSQQEKVKETCVQTHQEQELERVLQMSLQEQQQQRQVPTENEDELLQKVLSESNLEHMQQQQQEEEALEKALRMSMVETTAPDATAKASQEEEDDEELQRILRMSMMETSVSENGDVHAWQEELQKYAEFNDGEELQNQSGQGDTILEEHDTKPEAAAQEGIGHSGKQSTAESSQMTALDQSVPPSGSPSIENLPTGEDLLQSILYNKQPMIPTTSSSSSHEVSCMLGSGMGSSTQATTEQQQQQQQPHGQSSQESASTGHETGPSTAPSLTAEDQLAQILQCSMGSPIGSPSKYY